MSMIELPIGRAGEYYNMNGILILPSEDDLERATEFLEAQSKGTKWDMGRKVLSSINRKSLVVCTGIDRRLDQKEIEGRIAAYRLGIMSRGYRLGDFEQGNEKRIATAKITEVVI